MERENWMAYTCPKCNTIWAVDPRGGKWIPNSHVSGQQGCEYCRHQWDIAADCRAAISEMDGYVGVKYDTEKTRYDLIEPGFLEGLAKVLTFGAEKHGDTDYRSNPDRNAGTEYAAVMRHIEARRKGEKADPETGLDPLIHAAARLMTWWYMEKGE